MHRWRKRHRAGIATVYLGTQVPPADWRRAADKAGARHSVTTAHRKRDAQLVAGLAESLGPAGTVHRFFAGVEPFTKMIYTGVFARHPKLKIMDAELKRPARLRPELVALFLRD